MMKRPMIPTFGFPVGTKGEGSKVVGATVGYVQGGKESERDGGVGYAERRERP